MAVRSPTILSSESLFHSTVSPNKTPSALKAVFTPAFDGPVLQRIPSDHEAIDYIGRWDHDRAARWAGSSLRFRFDGPLLFLIPGDKTLATEFPCVGWQINGQTYTSHALPGRSIRLWPPETDAQVGSSSDAAKGQTQASHPLAQSASSMSADGATSARPTLVHSQSTSSNVNLSLSNNLEEASTRDHAAASEDSSIGDATPLASTFPKSSLPEALTTGMASTSISAANAPSSNTHTKGESRLIEITLIDWGSVLQVGHLETIAGYSITPAFTAPLKSLPSLLFIGDSLISGGFNGSSSSNQSGFLSSFPAQLRTLLAPGVRVSAIAVPGVALVEDAAGGSEGMETKFFKTGPLEPQDSEDNDWTFEDREDATGPTHIFVNLGANDTAPDLKFLSTLVNFLDVLKETHGRRTGDILVLAPFGRLMPPPSPSPRTEELPPLQRQTSASSSSNVTLRPSDQTRPYPGIKETVEHLAEQWAAEDPFQSGDFPATPILELTRAQLEQATSPHGTGGSTQSPFSPTFPGRGAGSRSASPRTSRPASGDFANAIHNHQTNFSQLMKLNKDGLPMPRSPSASSFGSSSVRPALIVRPSSVAAVEPNARGTITRLHYVDNEGWLDLERDTVDGLHPTQEGAKKIAMKLKAWLAEHGFLVET